MSKPLYNGCASPTDVTRAFEHAHKDITALEDKIAHLNRVAAAPAQASAAGASVPVPAASPVGLSDLTPVSEPIGTAGSSGASPDAARADHQHATPASAAPVDLGNANADGAAATIARSDHVHKRTVRVKKGGSDIGTRNAVNFIQGTNTALTVADNSGGDRVDVTVDVPDATVSVKGAVQLGGDLAGPSSSAASPAVVNASDTVYGRVKLSTAAASSTVPIAVGDNDSRMTNSRTPSGSAGGDLTGTYPNPTIASGAVTGAKIASATITDANVAAANKDGAAGTASLRTLGTGAAQAAAGNHTHAAADIVSGTIATARLGSGTADSTTVLYGDQTYKPAASANAIGFSTWSSATTYSTGDIIRGSDGNLYRSLVNSNTTHNPTTDAGSNWELYKLFADLTLNVPGTFSTILTALTFIQHADLQGQTLTIQVADGSYNYGTNTITLTHPQGQNISILGNTTTPANCNITFGSVGGVSVSGGRCLGKIDGFKLIGNDTANKQGIFANTQSLITTGTHMTVSHFDQGVTSSNGSFIFAQGVAIDHANNGGFIANNGYINCSNSSAANCGQGYQSINRGLVLAAGVTASSNTTGLYASVMSTIIATSPTLSGNTTNYSPTLDTISNKNSIISSTST